MVPAQKNMIDLISEVSLIKPTVPVISNISANPTQNPEEIRGNLIKQITGRVRWRESISYLSDKGINRFIEFGAGKVLSGLVKRTLEDPIILNIGEFSDLEKLREE